MLVYHYDGTMDGFYCCVYESVYQKEHPEAVEPEGAAQCRLLPPKYIETDPQRAERVRGAIPGKISPEALDLTETVFSSCLENKETRLLYFLLRGFKEGGHFLRAGYSDQELSVLLGARRHLMGEAHLLKGFIRFADVGGSLVATITPKNFVLPYIAGHFATRYRGENFLIFDKTHHVALLHENRQMRITAADNIEFPEFSEQEERYRALWKHFYHSVAIEARKNHRCRRTHCPKRYWENMLELQEEISKPQSQKPY